MKTSVTLAAMTLAGSVNACSLPEQRQFDFWIGDWEVLTPAGKVAGHNRIERAHGGCVITEHYTTPRGYSGSSLNAWDAAQRRWQQTWMDSGGLVLNLHGGWDGQHMQLEGEGRDAQGRPQRQRIRWTPNADGTVRQLWEQQGADGAWVTAFDGLYRRR